MTNLTDLTVAEIRDGVAAGTFSAREVASAFSAAVESGRALNAYIVETPELALAAADAADAARKSGDLKPLSGVPIGMKDLFCTEGVQTTAASHILEGFVPPYESTVSGKLWAAGAGMLGKLNLDQFAMGAGDGVLMLGAFDVADQTSRHFDGHGVDRRAELFDEDEFIGVGQRHDDHGALGVRAFDEFPAAAPAHVQPAAVEKQFGFRHGARPSIQPPC